METMRRQLFVPIEALRRLVQLLMAWGTECFPFKKDKSHFEIYDGMSKGHPVSLLRTNSLGHSAAL